MATALPPSRSKVYYQMEIGKNLVKAMNVDGILVSFENLAEDKKHLATWWLCLSPPDGKRDTIGEEGWQAEIPNRRFSTGKTLYWYLEEWINNWLPGLKPKHNYLYSTEKGNKVTTETYGHRVCNAFRRFIGSPVNPHLLRHILITYAYERGMTDAEKRSLAICQQHSEETQARIYNEQEMLNSLQPALKLNQKFLKEFYQSFNLNDLDPT
jgi:integrase